MRPTIQIIRIGNLGNQMFQYMFAPSLQMRVPGSVVFGYKLDQFRAFSPDHTEIKGVIKKLTGHDVDIDRIAYMLNAGIIDGVKCAGFFNRMNYYDTHRDIFAAMFNSSVSEFEVFGEKHLVINIRAGEIMRNVHPDYTPLPFHFYAKLIEDTGLEPVFMGQIDGSDYVNRLRAKFPSATFLESQGPEKDFETLRRSKNIVVAVSTFSWLAAWFSEAENIYFPISGFFNPQQRPDIDLLPVNDPRYHFYKFPPKKWTASKAEVDQLFSGTATFSKVDKRTVRHVFQS
jgi:hypothetical protein